MKHLPNSKEPERLSFRPAFTAEYEALNPYLKWNK